MTYFPSLNIFDAFELDVNVVNFVYYGKTQLITVKHSLLDILMVMTTKASNELKPSGSTINKSQIYSDDEME